MVDPILLEVFKNRLSAVAEEMGTVLQKSAFSSNIKERRDFSCAVFDKNGDLVAQASHIPVHLGSMPMSVKSALESITFKEGDMVALNDPYRGGTHLPDITVIAPVFIDGQLEFFVANRAHHADIGGITAGSMPLSKTIYHEGLIIPPVKIVEGGEVNRWILQLIKSNVRTPEEREGDFLAQISANITGIKRLIQLSERYPVSDIQFYMEALNSYSKRIMEDRINRIPDGEYSFYDFMEDDGAGNRDIKIQVDIKIEGSKATVDFSNSDPQTEGNINCVRAITLSAVYYVFRSLVREDIPTNKGCFEPIQVITKKGSVVDCQHPYPVAGGNVETSQRIVDVVLGALSKAIPDEIPSASQGTMNNLTIGGVNPKTGKPFTYYETIGGGMGASLGVDGESGIQSHMTNTLNTPVEALEFEYPFMVERYSLRDNSGGEGLYRGGDGIIRQIKFLTDVEITVISERRRIPPYGLFGGSPAKVGENILIRDGKEVKMGGKFHTRLKKGDSIVIKTPGGGGYRREG
ncbi:MAG: hydantoinase B/oxoprolinase family protein [Aquificae bacterium]|nr:hydantoinase B/oxoprolinase family protein [Aquificota bacterium]